MVHIKILMMDTFQQCNIYLIMYQEQRPCSMPKMNRIPIFYMISNGSMISNPFMTTLTWAMKKQSKLSWTGQVDTTCLVNSLCKAMYLGIGMKKQKWWHKDSEPNLDLESQLQVLLGKILMSRRAHPSSWFLMSILNQARWLSITISSFKWQIIWNSSNQELLLASKAKTIRTQIVSTPTGLPPTLKLILIATLQCTKKDPKWRHCFKLWERWETWQKRASARSGLINWLRSKACSSRWPVSQRARTSRHNSSIWPQLLVKSIFQEVTKSVWPVNHRHARTMWNRL